MIKYINDFKVGDVVYARVRVFRQGCEYVKKYTVTKVSGLLFTCLDQDLFPTSFNIEEIFKTKSEALVNLKNQFIKEKFNYIKIIMDCFDYISDFFKKEKK